MSETNDGNKETPISKPAPPPRPEPHEGSEKKSGDPPGEKTTLPRPQSPESSGSTK